MAQSDLIDFADLAQALLARAESLVPQWLPGGVRRGHEWVCGDLSGGEGESLSVNLITGRWADFAGDDKGGDLISLYAAIHSLNNGQAARQIQRDLGWARDDVQAPARFASQVVPRQPHGSVVAPAVDGGDDRPEPPVGTEKPAYRKSLWKAIVPVPAHAPKPDFKHWHYTEVAGSWEYSFEGVLYGYVVRYTTSDGGKEVLPHTWCVDESDTRGTCRWHFKQWDAPRPLYVPATVLSADLSLTVVLVEGEKCALAGHMLLGHEYDFVSWSGGGKAWPKAALGWLMGRKVILWPDVDAKREKLSREEREGGVAPESKPLLPEHKQPGIQAMVGAGQVLLAEHGCTVLMCPVPKPGAVSDGWDIADAIEQGWDAEQVRAFLRGAKPFNAPSDEARARAAPISTPSSAGAGKGDDESRAWRGKLILASSGAIKAVRENAVLALDGAPELGITGVPEVQGVIAYNEFTNDVIKLKATPWGTPAGVWDEVDELELGDWLVRTHWLPPMSRQTLEEAVTMVARRHRYHPARAHFEALKGAWDGKRRLATWLPKCVRKEAALDPADPLAKYMARVGTWLVMAICARVMNPGCKFDYMAIFEGGQGLGKSTLARLLGGEWFADTGLVLGDKDSYQNLQGVLVYEWGELDALTRAEVTKVKQFISSMKDRFRASFDRRAKDYPRQVVFIGTTNESHYLSDPTGNRRFWPIRVTRQIDLEWIRKNLDQLYAEALHYLAAGDRFHPTMKEQGELFDPQQLERTIENALESAIRKYLCDENQRVGMNGINGALINEVSLSDLLSALGISIDKQTGVLTKQASAALGRMGWERGRAKATHNGLGEKIRPWVYRRPADELKGATAGDAGGSVINGSMQSHATAGADSDCPF